MQTSESGLRQRRRERTWESIHQEAAALAAERGPKQTTAELIAERSGVSPRTFFNYFATKEDAILGLRPPRMDAELIESVGQAAPGGSLTYAAQVLVRVLRDSSPGFRRSEVHTLLHEHPELRRRMKIHMLSCEKALQDFLLAADWEVFRSTGRFVLPEGADPAENADGTGSTDTTKGADDAAAAGPDESVRERVRAMVMIAAAVLRHINFGADLDEDRIDQAIARTVTLFQDVIKESH